MGDEKGNWVVANDPKRESFALVLEGPREENNRFAEVIARLEGGALYRATISAEMLEEAKSRSNSRLRQRSVEIPLRDFRDGHSKRC